MKFPIIASALCAALGLGLVMPTLAQTTATVTVSAGSSTAAIPATAFGVNTAVWDGHLLDSGVPGLLSQAGVNVLRFPGGSTADVYHWATNTAPGSYVNPGNTFDAFMGVATAAGATVINTVNYGSNAAGTAGGDPSEAAAWVDYANNTKHYGVKYWEIGNELYGNGEYGSAWEKDLHADHSPTAYGQNAALFINAMKAKDPTIKVGVVLTAPGNWPDGQTPNWNAGVLAACGSAIDFVIIHWYPQGPGSESDSYLLSAPNQIANMVSSVKTLITQYCGANASNVQIFATETNSVSYNTGKQTVSLVNGLFLADNFMTWLERGVANVDWWDLHNGASAGNNNSASLYGTAAYGDYGMLSSGGAPEPAVNAPFPPYYGLQMLSYLGKPGDQMVAAASSQALLSVHAVRQAGGSLALLLINKDPSNTCTASVTVAGYRPSSTAQVYFYGKPSTAITSSTGTAGQTFTQSLPPYSLTTVVLSPLTAALSGTVTLLAWAGPMPTLTATITPTGATGGRVLTQMFTPGADGAFTLTNIPLGTYKVGIKGSLWLRKTLAVDLSAGNVSGLSYALTGGDVDNDNQIGANDLALVRKAFGTIFNMTNWNANADLNGDGQVAGTDVAIVRANYGQVGQ